MSYSFINSKIPGIPAALLHQLIQSLTAKLDLVTREEFDIQSQVLLKTRKKIENLEKKLEELKAKSSETL